jgi:hypothetical protein
MTYSEKLKDPRWQKKRLEIMQRDQWKCRRCKDDTKPLNVHHLRYLAGQEPWEYADVLLVTLCEDCHAREHENTPKKREIKTWPLMKVGDEQFFGYVCAIGFEPQDWDAPIHPWVCFEYGTTQTVYQLPDDEVLFKALADFITSNYQEWARCGNYSGKVWVRLTKNGYVVDLP